MTNLDEKIIAHIRRVTRWGETCSYDELAEATGACRQSVHKALRRMRAAGVISVRKVGVRNWYTITEIRAGSF